MSRLTRLLKKVCGASLGSERGRRGLTLSWYRSSGPSMLQFQNEGPSWPNGGYREPKRGRRGPKGVKT